MAAVDRSDVCKLIAVTYTTDAIGQKVPTETSRTVYCSKRSASRQEFFAAGTTGINPEYVLTLFSHDYSGEEIVEIGGSRYSVYRTYQRTPDDLELHVERKRGTV